MEEQPNYPNAWANEPFYFWFNDEFGGSLKNFKTEKECIEDAKQYAKTTGCKSEYIIYVNYNDGEGVIDVDVMFF